LTANSINNVSIRLTDERWHHITIGHPEMADYFYEIFETIENPNIIYEGNYGGLIAVSGKFIEINKFIIVIYKELSNEDGFVITAYCSNKIQQFEKKKILWKKQ
jgi:hypothetical protein